MRRITPTELLDRFRQAVWARAESLAGVRAHLSPSSREAFVDGADPAAVLARLAQRPPTWFEGETGPDPPPRDETELRRLAEQALQGRFDLLGFRGLDFGRPVDWHLEPTHRKRSPLVPWKRLDSLATDLSGDKKVVWELNRHQHLVVLARAWRRFGDPRYADAIAEQLDSWIEANPPALGINWTSSLELAFRAISWIWAIALLGPGVGRRALPAAAIGVSLHAHGVHIERFLSTWTSPNTHLTGEALGLYYLGTCVPELRLASRWRETGRRILLAELDRHVRPDGVYFEQSTWYHRYTADFYTHFILLAERHGDALPEHVRERHVALLEHLAWIARPDSTWPLVGDDDGGRLAALEERAPDDWRAVLATGAAMTGRSDFRRAAGELTEESRWLLGSRAEAAFARAGAHAPAALSRAFPDGGYYVMRSGWEPDSHYLLVDCGAHGFLNCGHAHADSLAIEVAAAGTSMVVDPGTFTYSSSPQARDRFRSSPAHSTLVVDGQSSSVPAGPFQWSHVADSRLVNWHDHPAFTYFEGSHDGYARLADPVVHTRVLWFVAREYWILQDRLECRAEHRCEVVYQAAPGAETLHVQGGVEIRRNGAALGIHYPHANGKWHLGSAPVSSCFGAAVEAPRAVFQVKAGEGAPMLAVLAPRAIASGQPEIGPCGAAAGRGLVVATGAHRDVALWRSGAAPDAGIVRSDFEWLWVRRTAATGSIERAVLLHGSAAAIDSLAIRTESPVAYLALSIGPDTMTIDVSPPMAVTVQLPPGIGTVRVNGDRALARVETLRD